jgi:hypothetical protein
MRKKGKSLFIVSSGLGEIFLLVFGLLAVAFVFGSGIGEVSADNPGVENTGNAQKITSLPSVRMPGTIPIATDVGKFKIIGETSGQQKDRSDSAGEKDKKLADKKTAAIIAGEERVKETSRNLEEMRNRFINTPEGDSDALVRNNNNYNSAKEANELAKNDLAKLKGVDNVAGVSLLSSLGTSLKHSFWIVGAIQFLGRATGFEDKEINSASLAAYVGITAADLAKNSLKKNPDGFIGKSVSGISNKLGISPDAAGNLIGVGIAVAIILITYEKEKQELVSFSCLPWEPPIGGSKCEQCNGDPYRPCSEYRCKALGQACDLLNPGTEEEKCVWVHPGDVNSPIIEPWKNVLKGNSGEELKYTPDSTIRPPARGVKIVTNNVGNECLPAYTPLQFGILLDEPAQCKIDFDRTDGFEEMKYFFGESNFHRYNHTQRMKLPSPSSAELEGSLSPIFDNDGKFTLYVRCQDANGNQNVDEFAISYCVDPSPDTTPPRIIDTSIPSGGAVSFGIDKVPIEVYINEPAQCRWSRTSKDFENMENEMSCDGALLNEINGELVSTCKGDLTGVEDRVENNFFFRCKDQPKADVSKRYAMTTSYPLILRGSQELNILEVKPNETIFGSTTTVPVELYIKTDDGADEGIATCYYNGSVTGGTMVKFLNTNSYEHRQVLDLPGASNGLQYNINFRCIDSGGNFEDAKTLFSVIVDKDPPIITRVYKEEGLKIVTNEDAQCVYSTQDCNYVFKEGLPLYYSNPSVRNKHFAEWKSNAKYYIKCKDEFGNEPRETNRCDVDGSIIVNAVQFN